MLAAVNFHYIRESFDYPYPSIFGITPQQFEDQLKILKKIGSFISQKDLRNSIENGDMIPNKSMIITFDDGLKEQYDLALPILKKLRIPATFFISSKTLEEKKILNVHKVHMVRSVVSPAEMLNALEVYCNGKEIVVDFKLAQEKGIIHYKYDTIEAATLKYLLNFLLSKENQEQFISTLFEQYFSGEEEKLHNELYMNEDQIYELGQLDYIGSHGYDHDPIALKNEKEQEIQIEKSCKVLSKVTGNEIYSFSYPYGSFNSCNGLATKLSSAGIKFAFTMERALNNKIENPYYLSRFDNNDMPLGKAYKHDSNNFFELMKFGEWFKETNVL